MGWECEARNNTSQLFAECAINSFVYDLARLEPFCAKCRAGAKRTSLRAQCVGWRAKRAMSNQFQVILKFKCSKNCEANDSACLIIHVVGRSFIYFNSKIICPDDK